MGYSGKHRRMPIHRLEAGSISEPTLQMVTQYLQSCAARWNSIMDLLEAAPPVKLDISRVRSRTFPEKLRQLAEEQTQAVAQGLAYMRTEKPIAPERRKLGVKRYSEYRLIANVIEQAVTEVLRHTDLSFVQYGAYQAVGRYCLSTLWRLRQDLPKTGLKKRLAKLVKPELKEMREEWQSWGLDMKTVLRIQRRVLDLFPGLVVALKGVRRAKAGSADVNT
jgi:hypothetical protein